VGTSSSRDTFRMRRVRCIWCWISVSPVTMIKYGNIALTTTITLLTQYHLCLLLLVRLGGYIVNLSDFYSYRIIEKLTVSLQLQEFSLRNMIVTPLLSRGVLRPSKSKSRQHPRQGCSFTYQLKYWWDTYHFKNTYSPITLANISSINLVFIFRCSSSSSNPVYARRVDSSALVFSLSSHLQSYTCRSCFYLSLHRFIINKKFENHKNLYRVSPRLVRRSFADMPSQVRGFTGARLGGVPLGGILGYG
jgi:hypothetical protein